MKFKELLLLPASYDKVIDILEISQRLPLTPREIISQFYAEHGSKEEFQEQYKELDLTKIHWEKILIEAESIINCSVYECLNHILMKE